MKVKIFFLLLGIMIIGNKISKAQAQYIDTNYKYTYKLKLQGVNSPGEAKIAKSNLLDLFDSKDFRFSQNDSIITVQSSVTASEQKLSGRINEMGYNVIFMSIKYNEIDVNSNK